MSTIVDLDLLIMCLVADLLQCSHSASRVMVDEELDVWSAILSFLKLSTDVACLAVSVHPLQEVAGSFFGIVIGA